MDSAIREDEKLLIVRAKNDPEAFGVLYDRYYPHIFRFVLSRTGNYELAQDLTAETFYQALKSIWRFRLQKRPISAWLYRIAIAQISNFYRKKSKYCEISLDENPEIINRSTSIHAVQHMALDKQQRLLEFAELHKILTNLKPIHHDVVVLRYFEDKSLADIGQILDMKLNTVKSHLRRALISLRELIYDNKIIKDERTASKLKGVLKRNES